MDTEYLITTLDMKKHPEGGYYKETYRASESYENESLPSRYKGRRSTGTSIYFLLPSNELSKFHKLASDEIWHFHLGGAAKIFIISPSGQLEVKTIGSDIAKGELLQVVILKDHWFGALVVRGEYILVGCTVSPGFEFEDFELATADPLKKICPEYSELIDRLT